jgi:hypothetical protein
MKFMYQITNDMSEQEKEEAMEVNENMSYDDQRENGKHNSKYGKNCKCADCQVEKRNSDKLLTKPF